jgi:large subunit ribosomal protein L16
MLMPKRTKYRKQQRGGRRKGVSKGARELAFGDFGLVAMEPAWITNRQMEAARVAIVRYLRRGGKTWFRIFPDKPYTKRAAETRMGSGKGSVEGWVAVVKRGRVIMELGGVDEARAREALRRASHKTAHQDQNRLPRRLPARHRNRNGNRR